MSKFEIKNQLKAISKNRARISPDSAWVSHNRQTLLQQIGNTVRVENVERMDAAQTWRSIKQVFRITFSQNILIGARTMSMVVLAGFVAVGSWIATVSAASNSLPGDALYNVKMAAEKTELFVTSVVGTPKDKMNTILKHASNRLEEYQKSKTSDQAHEAIVSLKNSIESASNNLIEVGMQKPEDAAAVARVVNEKTEQLVTSLEQVTSTVDGLANQKEVGETAHLIEAAGVKAVEVMVEKHLAGDNSVDLNDVKDTVEKKLDKMVTDISEINKDVTAAGTAIASSTVISSTTLDAAVSVKVESQTISTSTAVSSTSIQSVSVSEMAKVTEKKVEETNKIVQKEAVEAKSLIDNNDLLGALKKVQTLSDVKKDTGSTLADMKTISDAVIGLPPASAVVTTTVGGNTNPSVQPAKQ